MAASMESSGQTRAATLMNAARRSHFVSRIEKYEAKVRQSKALMKEQKDSSAIVEQKRPVSNTEGQHVLLSEELRDAVADQRRPNSKKQEQQHQRQHFVPERKMEASSEKALMHLQAASEMELRPYKHNDSPCQFQEQDLFAKKVHEKDYSLIEQVSLQHERGFLSQDEALYQNARSSSPEQRIHSEQKEIISGVLQRSSSSNTRPIVKAIDASDMLPGNASVTEKVFPVGHVPSDAHASIYFDFKPPKMLQVNIAAIAGALKIRIKAADMSEPMQEHAFRCARECLDAVGKLQSKRVAYTLKKEFDKVYGPAWHCIVGTSFGSYVTHSLGGFVYFSLEKVSVLLFKTTVEPI